MDTTSTDLEYLVSTFEEDDDPENLIGEAVEYDLAAALEED
ncbi:hypothetical protein GA0074695_4087 [Micromonospora viridifaciens]|uniref:Uncharacterized protein n=1 Tax=Micromonospora viridifaciens TaxID=1881 RepID=A0A1C4YC04_MICVI|nr:hypothetical protein [Micromonospora viridifaciens]SCF18238.1 hypothetical protein GA0074695_4087 [Micromonospora viridifaciens]